VTEHIVGDVDGRCAKSRLTPNLTLNYRKCKGIAGDVSPTAEAEQMTSGRSASGRALMASCVGTKAC
jgi:hypothetical protein